MAPQDPSTRRATKRAEHARAKAAKARRKRVLGLDAIVDVALRIVDREGVEAVSMRRVAAEFDTGPASLYAYVDNKDELLRAVLDRVIDDIEVPETADWQEMLRGYCCSVRAVYSAHNDLARLNFAHVPSGQNALEISERLIGAMLAGGVPPQVTAWALDVTALYLTADIFEGWLYGQRFSDDAGQAAEYFGALDERFAALPPDRYPNLVANRPFLMNGSSDDRFEFGLDMLIAGIESRVPESGRPGRRRPVGEAP